MAAGQNRDGKNILKDITWEVNDYNGISGALIVNANARNTSFFDISAYAGNGVYLLFSGFTLGRDAQKILFYDDDFSFLAGLYSSNDVLTFSIPSNAKYAKISVSKGGLNDNVKNIEWFTLLTNVAEAADTFTSGGYYSPDNGNFVTDNKYACYLVRTQNKKILVKGVVSGAFYDSNMAFLSGVPYKDDPSATVIRLLTVPDSAAFVGLNCPSASIGKIYLNHLITPDSYWSGKP